MKNFILLLIITSFLICCNQKIENSAAIATDKLDNIWWKDRHEQVLEQLQKDPQIILIGNSITHSLDNPDRLPIWEKYLNQYNAVNMGFSGDRTENVIWRLQNGEIDGINPKLATLLIGTNNTDGNNYLEVTQPKELAEGIKVICNIIREKLPETEILIIAILPFGKRPNYRDNINKATNVIVSEFEETDSKIHYRDIGHIFMNEEGKVNKELMPDYLHPNAEGHMLMFEALEKDVTDILNVEM